MSTDPDIVASRDLYSGLCCHTDAIMQIREADLVVISWGGVTWINWFGLISCGCSLSRPSPEPI